MCQDDSYTITIPSNNQVAVQTLGFDTKTQITVTFVQSGSTITGVSVDADSSTSPPPAGATAPTTTTDTVTFYKPERGQTTDWDVDVSTTTPVRRDEDGGPLEGPTVPIKFKPRFACP